MSSMKSPTANRPEDRGNPGSTGTSDRPSDLAAAAAQKARDVAGSVAENAEKTASLVSAKAGEAASFVGKKAEEATSAAGDGLKSLAQSLREHTPANGPLSQASSAVAAGLESGGRYLQEEGLQGIASDVTALVRRNPIPAVFVALGVGFLMARATSSRS